MNDAITRRHSLSAVPARYRKGLLSQKSRVRVRVRVRVSLPLTPTI